MYIANYKYSRTNIFRLSGEMKYISDDTQQLFITNQINIYLLLLIVSLQKGILLFNSIIFEVMPNCFVFQYNIWS